MNCLGPLCDMHQPKTIRCDNVGGKGLDVKWNCAANLPDYLSIGHTKIECEGFSRPQDEYVLRGSCTIEYSLVRHPRPIRKDGTFIMSIEDQFINPATIFTMVWVLVLFMILYSLIKAVIRSHNTISLPTYSNYSSPASTPASSPLPGQSFNLFPHPGAAEGPTESKSWMSVFNPFHRASSPTASDSGMRLPNEGNAHQLAPPSTPSGGNRNVRKPLRRRRPAGVYTPSPLSASFSPMDLSFPPSPVSPQLTTMSALFPPTPSPMRATFGSSPPSPYSPTFN